MRLFDQRDKYQCTSIDQRGVVHFTFKDVFFWVEKVKSCKECYDTSMIPRFVNDLFCFQSQFNVYYNIFDNFVLIPFLRKIILTLLPPSLSDNKIKERSIR